MPCRNTVSLPSVSCSSFAQFRMSLYSRYPSEEMTPSLSPWARLSMTSTLYPAARYGSAKKYEYSSDSMRPAIRMTARRQPKSKYSPTRRNRPLLISTGRLHALYASSQAMPISNMRRYSSSSGMLHSLPHFFLDVRTSSLHHSTAPMIRNGSSPKTNAPASIQRMTIPGVDIRFPQKMPSSQR